MHKYIITLFFILTFVSAFYFLHSHLTEPAIQFFPIDEQASISDAMTDLSFDPESEEVTWITDSTSSDIAYLRQDISLLYENGKFKGLQNEWKQHVNHVKLENRFKPSLNSVFQAISFHHGEIHYSDNQIFSVQKMTGNKLYIIKQDNKLYSFQEPQNSVEQKLGKKLDTLTSEKLLSYWDNLINHFKINEGEYYSFPLTDLLQFENNNLPGKNREETEKIIGQLWEGLYKNYILLLTEPYKDHYVPLIMFAKEGDHLLVLFELDDKEMLIQKIPA